jgi:hypothetical protein
MLLSWCIVSAVWTLASLEMIGFLSPFHPSALAVIRTASVRSWISRVSPSEAGNHVGQRLARRGRGFEDRVPQEPNDTPVEARRPEATTGEG